MGKQVFNVLALDGGGARGTALIEQLCHFESEVLKAPLTQHFDMFSGTSTGAIIAAMLSAGYSTGAIRDLYKNHGPKIFKPSFWRFGLLRSKYSDKYFNEILDRYLGSRSLAGCVGGLLIPAYNATTREVVVFTSYDWIKRNARLSDVVRASASAPTFFDPWIIDSQVYIDGGMVINNPALMCYTEALKLGHTNINILSFGTGRSEPPVDAKRLEKGILKNASTLFDICLTEQVQTTTYMLGKLYELKNESGVFVRCECVIDKGSGEIDDFSDDNIEAMLSDGLKSFELNAEALNRFVALSRQ